MSRFGMSVVKKRSQWLLVGATGLQASAKHGKCPLLVDLKTDSSMKNS